MAFTLATDLDGTFLAQDAHLAEPLYDQLRRSSRSTLIFVTGRSLETIRSLVDDLLIPTPDFIIADVGATVVDGRNFAYVQPLQSEIVKQWPGPVSLYAAIPELEELERQPVPQDRRMSFYARPDQVTEELLAKIHSMHCDAIFSHGRYFDILPRGVNKGSSLRRLLAYLKSDPSSVVVAGDTMNDHAMFMEGMNHFNLFTAADVTPEAMTGTSDLVMVYHRLPYQELRNEDGSITRIPPKSPNGILPTLLGVFRGGVKGAWVAWTLKGEQDLPPESLRVPIDEKNLPDIYARLVPLSAGDVKIFYETFSKEALWPIIFNFIERATFNHEHWKHFQKINRLFAEATAREAAPGATVWIHDYNLWLVPAYLRAIRPDLTIAFFHHTSFPSFDALSVLPWWGQIISSLLQCDYIGFHIPRYISNFVDAVSAHTDTVIHETAPAAPRFLAYGAAVSASSYPSHIATEYRNVRMGPHPVGINADYITSVMKRPVTQQRITQLQNNTQKGRIVLSVERIDYVKGQLEKLAAFERLLEQHPEHQGNLTLINICTPAAPGMKIYESLQLSIEQAIGRINGRFGTMQWTPVHFFFRSMPFDELMPYYAIADIAWITPLRDGLNLVAKEYVIAKECHDQKGVLLLSEFAGAAAELHGALLVNPYDVISMADKLHQACNMPLAEQKYRMECLARIIRHHDIHAWAEGFMEAAKASADHRQPMAVGV